MIGYEWNVGVFIKIKVASLSLLTTYFSHVNVSPTFLILLTVSWPHWGRPLVRSVVNVITVQTLSLAYWPSSRALRVLPSHPTPTSCEHQESLAVLWEWILFTLAVELGLGFLAMAEVTGRHWGRKPSILFRCLSRFAVQFCNIWGGQIDLQNPSL